MNQEKIGKFISEKRKNKNLTQEKIGESLGVSINAVSKWERGINLPDISIMQDMCHILDITLNDLFAGETISESDMEAKSNENIINVVNYTSQNTKKKINKFKISIVLILLLVLLIATMFIIDINRMKNNKSVIFSTWGLKYYPPINLEEEKIYNTIIDYVVKESDNDHKRYKNQKSFASMRIFLIEDKKDAVCVYAWVLEESLYLNNNKITKDSASSIPHKFTLVKENNIYIVEDYKIPRDGGYYEKDIKNLFPLSVRKDMLDVHYDGTIDRLALDIERQANLYFHK